MIKNSATKFRAPYNVVNQPENTMACTVKFRVPKNLCHVLDTLYPKALMESKKMLKNRKESSSKFYKEIPCVVSKSLIAKYQRNPRIKTIKNLVIPICGDKGRQIKREQDGIRIPSLFKKSVIPVIFSKPVSGFLRSVEFIKCNGVWLGCLTYNTPTISTIETQGCIGVDRNSVGNIAVFVDSENKTVRKLGICPARTKFAMRGRRKNLQKAGKKALLRKLRRKQRRRMTHENHRVSKSIVDYAALHRRAVAIEDLSGVNSTGSKVRRYSEKNQWAFAQLETFLRYKCALRGIPLIKVNPAYTSQTCSRCGKRHKPSGKRFSCGSCGLTSHRDVNAAFNIAALGCIGGSSNGQQVPLLRHIGSPQTGNLGGAS